MVFLVLIAVASYVSPLSANPFKSMTVIQNKGTPDLPFSRLDCWKHSFTSESYCDLLQSCKMQNTYYLDGRWIFHADAWTVYRRGSRWQYWEVRNGSTSFKFPDPVAHSSAYPPNSEHSSQFTWTAAGQSFLSLTLEGPGIPHLRSMKPRLSVAFSSTYVLIGVQASPTLSAVLFEDVLPLYLSYSQFKLEPSARAIFTSSIEPSLFHRILLGALFKLPLIQDGSPLCPSHAVCLVPNVVVGAGCFPNSAFQFRSGAASSAKTGAAATTYQSFRTSVRHNSGLLPLPLERGLSVLILTGNESGGSGLNNAVAVAQKLLVAFPASSSPIVDVKLWEPRASDLLQVTCINRPLVLSHFS